MRPRPESGRRIEPPDFNVSPFTVAWEITRACALTCLHCGAEAQPRRDPRELTPAEALAVVDQVRDVGDPILVVTGGDPLMRRDVYDILAYAVRRGLRTSLTPTATALVTPAALARARDAGVSRIGISLDGPRPEVHDRFRGFQGSFARTIEITRNVSEAGLALQINTSVTRHNLAELREMPEIVADAGAVQWSVFFLVPTGRGKLEDLISPEEHEDVFHWLYGLSQDAPFDIKTTAAPAYRRVAMQRRLPGGDAPEGPGFRFRDGLDRPAFGVNDGNGFAFISHVGECLPLRLPPNP